MRANGRITQARQGTERNRRLKNRLLKEQDKTIGELKSR